VELAEGDLLFLYTDGLTETKGPDGEEDFGEDRLNDLLREQREETVRDLFEEVTARLQAFSGRYEADDDITMLALKITAADEVYLSEAGGAP
jgi:sigma-B regulation protein RsbU (phosphoserine phosphatase)